MAHKVFIRHTYIYKCSSCKGEWKINEAENIEYVLEDQRTKYKKRWN